MRYIHMPATSAAVPNDSRNEHKLAVMLSGKGSLSFWLGASVIAGDKVRVGCVGQSFSSVRLGLWFIWPVRKRGRLEL